MRNLIRTVLFFTAIMQVIWAVAKAMAASNADVKSLAAEQNLASLANDVANLMAGNFPNGIKIGGDLYMNGHNIFMGSTSTIGDAGGGDFHTNGGSLIDRAGTVLAFP